MNRSLRPLSSPLTALSPLSVWDHVSARFAAMTRDGAALLRAGWRKAVERSKGWES